MGAKKESVPKKITRKNTKAQPTVSPKKKSAKKKKVITSQVRSKGVRRKKIVDLAMQLVQTVHAAEQFAPKKMKTFLTVPDEYGYTPLMYAALFNDTDSLLKILEFSHTVFSDNQTWVSTFLEQHDTVRGWTALHCAVVRRNKEIVELLIKDSVKACKDDTKLLRIALVPLEKRHQWTPLMFAVNNADYQMTELLLTLYKKYLVSDEMKRLLSHEDERGQKVYSYTTRDDIHRLLKQYGGNL
jgi:ankyrin repeat protein